MAMPMPAVALLPLDFGIYRNEKCGGVNARNFGYPVFIFLGKAVFRNDAEIRKARFLKEIGRVCIKAHPFHIETDENADSESRHDYH